MGRWLLAVGALVGIPSAGADVVLVMHPHNWTYYWCNWDAHPYAFIAACDASSVIERDEDYRFIFGADFEELPGPWSYYVAYYPAGSSDEGYGCSFEQTTIGGDPRGAYLNCP